MRRGALIWLTLLMLSGTAAAHNNPQAATGYQANVVVQDLAAPVGVAVDGHGTLFVAEAGSTQRATPRVLRVRGDRREVVSDFPAALTGLTWHDGRLFVSYGGVVVEVSPSGATHVLVTDLPSHGDYPNMSPVVGPDGRLFFGQGTATNSGVVGPDNAWIKDFPEGRDIPCRDLTLRGPNFSSGTGQVTATGAFSPYAKTTARGQTIRGQVPCNGAILAASLNGSRLDLVAWGLREPRSLTFGPDGSLYVVVGGMEDRGSRPVAGDQDYLYRIEPGRWYGWPDFAGGKPVTQSAFHQTRAPAPMLLLSWPDNPPKPVLSIAKDAGLRALAYPPSSFGPDSLPVAALSGKPGHTGQIATVNLATGTVSPLLPSGQPGPAHPVAMAFAPDGSLYVADIGEWNGSQPQTDAGRIWHIVPGKAQRKTLSQQLQWNWALSGFVIAVAGVHLVTRRRP